MRPYKGLTKNGKWVYGWYIRTRFTDTHWIIKDGLYVTDILIGMNPKFPMQLQGCYKVIPETVGQQIDFQDRNGIEIYEHDILDSCWVVRFFDGHYVLCNPTDEPAKQCAKEMLDGLVAKKSIVTGNIHCVD